LLRSAGAFLVNLIAAVVGTLLIEAPLEHFVSNASVRGSLFRLDVLNSVSAFGLGYLGINSNTYAADLLFDAGLDLGDPPSAPGGFSASFSLGRGGDWR
jgi:hypothetical protein